jgi:high affinity sulfate transporter 1
VTVGFTSGSAVVIIFSQLKDIMGVTVPNAETVQETAEKLNLVASGTNGYIVGLFFAWLAYLLLHKFTTQRFRKYLFWLEPLGPLIAIVAGGLILQASPDLQTKLKGKWVGSIPGGLPKSSVNAFSAERLSRVFLTSLVAFVVGDMEAIAIGRGLAQKNGYMIDAHQELFAQGISNLVGSFFNCYCATGSFSRSAVNAGIGAKTQTAALISALVMMFTLLFLTKLFFWIPKFVLAAVIVNAVLPLLNLPEAWHIFKKSKADFLVWLTVAVVVMFWGIAQGIAAGIILSLMMIIYESAVPQITILWRIPGTTIYRNIKQENSGRFVPNMFICRLASSLYFANAGYVKEKLLEYIRDLEKVNEVKFVILEMTSVASLDYTAALVLKDLLQEFKSRGIQLVLAMVGERFHQHLQNHGLLEIIGEEWLFQTVHEAVQGSLRHQHAQLKNENSEEVSGSQDEAASGSKARVALRDELGISNDLDKSFTTVFLSLEEDAQGLFGEVTRVFQVQGLSVQRAQVEVLPGGGAQHRYTVKSLETNGQLTEKEIFTLQVDLSQIFKKAQPVGDIAI